MAISTTIKKITDEFWRRGNLNFLLKPKQIELKNFLLARPDRRVVANAHRQFGKSTCMFAICCEFAIKNPRSITKFGAPTGKQVKEIIRVVKDTVLDSCPKDMMPVYKKADGEFVFPNGSIIKMIGVDIDDGDRLRGTPADFVILDEAGFMGNLENLVYSVIEPQFLQRSRGRLVMISTPSTAVSHDYTRIFIPQARGTDNYWELKITENPQFSKDQIQLLMDKYASVDLNGNILVPGDKNEKFRREFLCEVFTSTDLMIIPEWQHFKYHEEGQYGHMLVKDIPRPQYFQLVVAMDFGFVDRTGILIGWVNKQEGHLYIRDEIFVNYKTPSEIAVLIQEKLHEHFPGGYSNMVPEPLFTADIQLQDIQEIRNQSGITFKFAEKYNKEAAITSLRQRISTSGIIVHPCCKNLILQLDTGTWKNEERTGWERTEHMGHLDLIDALIYMNRKVPWKKDFTPVVEPSYHNAFTGGTVTKKNDFSLLRGR